MAEATQNYNLTCPSETDYYNIEVQNENMRKLDAALASCINVGMYVGDGEAVQTVSLPRTPKFVLVMRNGSLISLSDDGTYQYGGLAITGYPAFRADACVEITEGGFTVTHLTSGGSDPHVRLCLNTVGERYSYIWG